jgi:hypothetical protein
MEHGLVKKLKGPQLAKKSPTSYGTRRFVVAFAKARHLSLSYARSIHSMSPSHFMKIRFYIYPPVYS